MADAGETTQSAKEGTEKETGLHDPSTGFGASGNGSDGRSEAAASGPKGHDFDHETAQDIKTATLEAKQAYQDKLNAYNTGLDAVKERYGNAAGAAGAVVGGIFGNAPGALGGFLTGQQLGEMAAEFDYNWGQWRDGNGWGPPESPFGPPHRS